MKVIRLSALRPALYIILLLGGIVYSGHKVWEVWRQLQTGEMVVQLQEQSIEPVGSADLTEPVSIGAYTTGPEADIQQTAESGALASYRLERKRLLARQIETLETVMNKKELGTSVQEQATLQLLALLEQTGQEEKIEMLLRACGIADCVAVLERDHVSVLLREAAAPETLTELRGVIAQILALPEDHIAFLVQP
jgi:hypothetical protein